MHADERKHMGNLLFHFADLRTPSEHEELSNVALNHLELEMSEWKRLSRNQRKQ